MIECAQTRTLYVRHTIMLKLTLELAIDVISACMTMDTANKSDIVEQGPRLKSEIKRKQRRISYHKERKQDQRRPGRVKRLQKTVTKSAAKIESLQVETATLQKSINKSVAEKKLMKKSVICY